MIKKTLYFGNPVYLSLKNAQLMIKLPEVVRNDTLPESFKRTSEVTKPIEDIGCFQWLKVTKMKANHNFRVKGFFIIRLFPMAQSY